MAGGPVGMTGGPLRELERELGGDLGGDFGGDLEEDLGGDLKSVPSGSLW